MKRKPERIETIVKSIIEGLDRQSNPTSDEIGSIWKEVAGKKAFIHAKPASLRKKRLVINVDGSGWLYELTLRKKELLAGLKNRLGKDKIKELQFRIGEL
jgi:predicted nucleic acid-binding Zn ribbon protein